VIAAEPFAALLLKLIEMFGSWVLSQLQNHLQLGKQRTRKRFAF
jgi:hypothetical protein